MREILQWLRPGTRVKRYILLQIISIAIFVFCVITLRDVYDLNRNMLIAYICLITLSLFGIVFSFLIAQKNILSLTLKNISKKSKNTELRRLIYSDPSRKKGQRVVIIGGGSGLSNILQSLKEYTANITTVIDVSESEEINNDYTKNARVTTGDIRKCIAAMSISEGMVEKVLTNRVESGLRKSHSVGSLIISSMISITGSFQEALDKIPEFFKIEGQILPTTIEETSLCAGLENGEIIVGKNNISPRVSEIKSSIKQVFLKDGSIKANPKVIDAIKHANVIVLGPGALYTAVISNLLLAEVSKAIISSKAKKIFIANLMNSPGETDGFTLAKHVNEVERYLGKHVLDYVIANNGQITNEMVKDFNQGNSAQVMLDIENIQNRAISVITEDLVMTAPSSIIHNSKRVSEIIMSIAKTKKIGKLNIVNLKKKHMKKEKKVNRQKSEIKVKTAEIINTSKDAVINIIKENKINKKEKKIISKISKDN
ncbi:MAG: YvcK family protein [Clostridia bacterium]